MLPRRVRVWQIASIEGERHTRTGAREYHVQWAGVNSAGRPWAPSWVHDADVKDIVAVNAWLNRPGGPGAVVAPTRLGSAALFAPPIIPAINFPTAIPDDVAQCDDAVNYPRSPAIIHSQLMGPCTNGTAHADPPYWVCIGCQDRDIPYNNEERSHIINDFGCHILCSGCRDTLHTIETPNSGDWSLREINCCTCDPNQWLCAACHVTDMNTRVNRITTPGFCPCGNVNNGKYASRVCSGCGGLVRRNHW